MPENREKFAMEFVTKLNGKISDDALSVVLKELQVFVDNYDIQPRETALSAVQSPIMEYYQAFVVSKKIEGKSVSSLKTYHYYLTDFFDNMHKSIEDITTNDVRIYLYNLQERRKISNRSLDARRIVINSFLKWCVQEGYISNNPCSKISSIKFEEKKREPLTDVEFELLRNACKTYREKAMVELFYSTGCRVTELIRLNKTDVDFQTKEVFLFGKGNKHRTVYLNAKAEVALKKYLFTRQDDSEALFVTERKPQHRLCKNSVEAIIKNLGERAKLTRNIYPHLIRHTTATDCLNRGMEITTLQKLLGHSDIKVTTVYAKVNQDTLKHEHKKYVL